MSTARDIMMPGVECVNENESLVVAAQKMRDFGVGSLPICGDDNKLKGMLTDRDIVVKAIADAKDPLNTLAGALAEGAPITVGVDDDISEALATMKKHQVRRLPVMDGHELVGIISQGDIANALSNAEAGALVEEISQPS
jgi:CBS domain-containing protein